MKIECTEVYFESLLDMSIIDSILKVILENTIVQLTFVTHCFSRTKFN